LRVDDLDDAVAPAHGVKIDLIPEILARSSSVRGSGGQPSSSTSRPERPAIQGM
jgi:hypothetical protein